MTSSTDQSAHQIEPGVVNVFRLFLAVEWVVLAVVVLALGHIRALRFDVTVMLNWIEVSVLLLYLFWSDLRDALGRAYLPVALTIACVGPVVWQAVGTSARVRRGVLGVAALVDPNSLFIWLLVPLVLIAAQYGVRAVIMASAGTSLLSVVLVVPLARAATFAIGPQATSAFTRFLIFSAVGTVVALLTRAQRHYRLELALRQQQVAQYAMAMEQLSVSRERNRIAREMHDTLAHTLSAVSVQLQAIDTLWASKPDAARDMLRQTQDTARGGLDEARRALHELRAQPLESLGLTLAIRRAAERTCAHIGAQLSFAAHSVDGRLPPDVEQQVYRVAEEALSNVAQHSRARNVTVQLACDGTSIVLLVRDDGLGFDTSEAAQRTARGHYGMAGMRERALMVGASFAAQSAPGGGTLVRLDVPLGPR